MEQGKPEPKTAGARIWLLLNSPFALFLLSSVVIAGVSRMYTDHQVAARAQAEQAGALEGALAEMERRVSVGEYYAKRLEDAALPPQARGRAGVMVGSILNPIDKPGGTEYGVYDGTILVSMIDRGLRVAPDQAVQTAILDTGSIWMDSGHEDYRRAVQAVPLLRAYVDDRRSRAHGASDQVIRKQTAALARQAKAYLESRSRPVRARAIGGTPRPVPPAHVDSTSNSPPIDPENSSHQ